MGMRKNGWIIWASLLILAVGVLVTGAFANHYFYAKATSNEAMNQQKHEKSGQNQSAANALTQTVKDTAAEKESMHQKQQQAEKAYRQNADKEITNLVEEKPAANDTASAPPDNQGSNAAKPQEQSPQRDEQPQPQQENSSKRTVYLTFDDGPASFSKDIIALLEQYHFKATFFMIDGNIRRYPDSAKLMVQSGEGVGLHSVSHDVHKFYASANSVLGELSQNQATLKEITGVESILIRTPYGSRPYMKDEYKQAVYSHGYQMWDWNIDSKDWFYKDERYVNSVIEQINQKANYNGPIVILMHERRETLASLPKLLDYLSKQNFDCRAIDSSIPPVHF
ncbi:polysaccharide deacetylase family protein [Neobacillus massiliamazoniensis]|uniref:Endo-1,4-beta-xylanase n=1 Tax=Neobacillus massiliamazoniensis TaxID=1499688 RepID=A0A0U1NU26_9BACI|nr:polysaccharide deacetylase family protein [Neobacillus massiliamazoniensis]CRK81547.1 endo-1,4-beta-xylanase [Neobacillus massiliamazoniensis]